MLGLPTGTDLNGIADKLSTIVASLGPEESAVVNSAIAQLSEHGSALIAAGITQAGDMIATDLSPLIEESKAWRAEAQAMREAITAIANRISIAPPTLK